ncbi:MAG: sulfatase [Planctomycetota bacterium]
MATPFNVMLLVGEDTGRHLGCYGDAFARTPRLDRLAAEGCRFTNAYAPAPVCAPSRATLVTGQDPRKIGTHLMRCVLRDPPPTFTHALQDAGYLVDWTNKTDFNFTTPDGFATRQTDWRDDLAAGRLNDRPFFLYQNFGDTHESGMWPPDVRKQGHENPTPAPEPRADDPALDDLPGLVVPPYLPDTRVTRASLARYYEHIEAQDAFFGSCLDALEASGAADRTVVIYLTDHGRGLVREKRWCYEAGVHLPLIVRGPAGSDLTTPGSVRDELVSWIDLAPTFHALAGLDIPDRYDGRVFLGPDTQPEAPFVFFGRDRMDEAHDKVRGAADRRYLYLRNDRPDIPYAQGNLYMEVSPVTTHVRELHAAGDLPFPQDLWMRPTKPADELYDKVADPHCVHNLAGRADHADVVARMRRAVDSWCAAVDDRGAVPERRHIEAGLIQDQTAALADRVHRLPEPLRAGGVYDTHFDPDRV